MSAVSNFIVMLMNSRNQSHVFHLTTNSYAQHKALQKYYEGIIPLADAYAETYMANNKRLKFGDTNKKYMIDPKKAKGYFQNLLRRINKLKLPNEPELKNILDDIKALIKGTLYKLTLK